MIARSGTEQRVARAPKQEAARFAVSSQGETAIESCMAARRFSGSNWQSNRYTTTAARRVPYWMDRRGHVFGKGGPCLGAAFPAKAGMGAVFRDNQRLGFGKIEHLTHRMAGGHPLIQGRAATGTSLGKMINRGIRVLGSAQGLAGMTLLPTRLLA